jgi:hypothetical protein
MNNNCNDFRYLQRNYKQVRQNRKEFREEDEDLLGYIGVNREIGKEYYIGVNREIN